MVTFFKKFAPALLISVVITAVVAVVYNYELLEGFEARIYNSKLMMREQIPQTGNVVIAVIDNASVSKDQLGRWPWPRSYIGMLVDALNRHGAKVIGFDVFFTEPDENVPLWGMRNFLRTNFELMGLDQPDISKRKKRKFLSNLREFYDILLGAEFERNPEEGRIGDKVEQTLNPDVMLANTLDKYDNVILGYYFGEAKKPEKYKEDVNRVYGEIKVVFDFTGEVVPDWLKKDRKMVIGFLDELESLEEEHVPFEELHLKAVEFLEEFGASIDYAVSESGNYQLESKNAILDFYSLIVDYMLPDIAKEMAIISENPGEELTEEIKSYYKGMEDSAVEYNEPGGSVNPFMHSHAMTPNIARFTEKTKHFGHVYVKPDPDGVIRHHYATIYYGGLLFPSLGLEAAGFFSGQTPSVIMPQPGQRPRLYLGDKEIPLEDDGTMLINYLGPKSYPHYSIYHIISGMVYAAPMEESVAPYFEEVMKTTPEEYYKKQYGQEPLEGDIGFMLMDVWVEGQPLAKHIALWEGDKQFEQIYGVTPEEAFKDKIVLVGSTATGAYDLRVTPFSENTPGVEIHATVIDSILKGVFMKTPTWSRTYTLISMLVIAIIMAVVLPFMGALRGAVLTLVILVGILSFDYLYMFAGQGLWLPISYQSIQLGLLFLFVTLYRYATEEREKRFIKDTFGRYLAPSVVEHLTANPELLQLGGEELELTAFFSDIQGFSTISEKLDSAKRLVDLLNDYLSEMAQVIEGYEGTIDKYEGDAIIAFWGAPLHFPDHALKACYACLDQQTRLAELREKWKNEGQWPEIVHNAQVRMGVNTGKMVVGNMGSAGRMNYTMMGDAVNLAARLEGANKVYGTYIMIAENTYAKVKNHVETRELDKLRVVGKTEPVVVYQLISRRGQMDPHMARVVEVFLEGLHAYKKMDWGKAIGLFETALNIDPGDGPSRTYLERCRSYLAAPPPEGWDGVFSLTSK